MVRPGFQPRQAGPDPAELNTGRFCLADGVLSPSGRKLRITAPESCQQVISIHPIAVLTKK